MKLIIYRGGHFGWPTEQLELKPFDSTGNPTLMYADLGTDRIFVDLEQPLDQIGIHIYACTERVDYAQMLKEIALAIEHISHETPISYLSGNIENPQTGDILAKEE